MITSHSHIKTMLHAGLIQLPWLVFVSFTSTYSHFSERAVMNEDQTDPFSVHFYHHCCRQWQRKTVLAMLEMKPWEHDERPSHSWNATSCDVPHPVSFCPSELNPYIHQSYTLCDTHSILKKNSLPSKCKQNKLRHNSFFAFRRHEKERHSSYCQIYNYSSLKRIKWKLNKVL